MQLNITSDHEKSILSLAAKIKGSYGGRAKSANGKKRVPRRIPKGSRTLARKAA